ncbi:MAG: substrate-binding domain-containing protein [Clostridiales bacterium]|nr:substrate-binding domain-containing protein [Clostridiales bacterium]
MNYPTVSCHLSHVDTGQEIDTLLRNEADIAILVYPYDTIENNALEVRTISIEPMCLVSGLDSDIAKHENLSMKDFKDETLIVSNFPPSHWMDHVHESISPYFKNVSYVNNLDTVIVNLSLNQGIAIWPRIVVQDTQNYSKILNVPEFQYSTRLCAIWSKENANPNIQKFLRFCR